ncbi:hypothetical protein CNE_1c09240 [Cupriavidus necator N-1]|uniref:DUF2917 domain-containing protein n=1 Tax=Cupriavidus necator (strain ATCC 43291 / DSM 13513 / CCUG 52238 / LMG 8453 / N-1) TaxID=1042878 RepID=G0EZ17_CUPNN|nr:hypothetical protein [Cupriavidus necator]AEI76282.1 hypothetical protein CNE_1c09240 [Cupriavidus necator N-1]MDX6011594.1 hypothetical protein [Cupriavidus necator]
MQSDLNDTSTVMPLSAGQCLRVRVAAGTVLRAGVGELEVAGPPQWLADTCYVPRRRLRAGDMWIVPARGWLAVSASRAGALLVTAPPGWLPRLRAWLAWSWRRTGPARQPVSRPIPDSAPERL